MKIVLKIVLGVLSLVLQVVTFARFLGKKKRKYPPPIYVALFTSDRAWSNANEVQAPEYKRRPILRWRELDRGGYVNADMIDFGVANSQWGPLRSIGFWDAETGGEFLAPGDLETSLGSIRVIPGDHVFFKAESIFVTKAVALYILGLGEVKPKWRGREWWKE